MTRPLLKRTPRLRSGVIRRNKSRNENRVNSDITRVLLLAPLFDRLLLYEKACTCGDDCGGGVSPPSFPSKHENEQLLQDRAAEVCRRGGLVQRSPGGDEPSEVREAAYAHRRRARVRVRRDHER